MVYLQIALKEIFQTSHTAWRIKKKSSLAIQRPVQCQCPLMSRICQNISDKSEESALIFRCVTVQIEAFPRSMHFQSSNISLLNIELVVAEDFGAADESTLKKYCGGYMRLCASQITLMLPRALMW